MLRVHGGSCVVLLWSGQQLDDDADYSLSVLLVVFCIILYPTSYAAALPCPVWGLLLHSQWLQSTSARQECPALLLGPATWSQAFPE